MYNVSLLPQEYRMLHKTARKKDISLLLAIFVMCSLLIVYLYFSFASASKEAQLDQIKYQNSVIENEITKLEGLEVLSNEVDGLLALVESAADKNPVWYRFITVLGNLVPESVGLKSMDLKFINGMGEANIKGIAVDYQTVIDWLRNLETMDGIDNIKCSYVSKVEGSPPSVEFEVVFSILPGSGYGLDLEVIGQ